MSYKYNKEQMTFVKDKWSNLKKMGVGFYLVISTLFLVSSFVFETKPKEITLEQAVMVINREDSFSKEKLVEFLIDMNVKHPHIVMAQAIIESGNFSSPIFNENNNMFGMRKAYSRSNLQIGVNRNHATYRNWRDCVVDYALYQNRYTAKLTEIEYLRYLQQNYAEAPTYFESIKSKSQECKKYFK